MTTTPSNYFRVICSTTRVEEIVSDLRAAFTSDAFEQFRIGTRAYVRFFAADEDAARRIASEVASVCRARIRFVGAVA